MSESDVPRGESGAGRSDRSTKVVDVAAGPSPVVAVDFAVDGAEAGTSISAGGAARLFDVRVETGMGASSGLKDALFLEFEVGLATCGVSRIM